MASREPDFLRRIREDETRQLTQMAAERDAAYVARDAAAMRAAELEIELDETRAYVLALEAELFPRLNLPENEDAEALG